MAKKRKKIKKAGKKHPRRASCKCKKSKVRKIMKSLKGRNKKKR